MDKEVISDSQGIKTIMVFILGSTLIIGAGGAAGKDMWLSDIIATIFSIPVVLMYSRILHDFPDKDLFDILNMVFGKFIGKIISILYIWFSFHLGALVLRNYGEFSTTAAMPETPMAVPILALAGVCIYGVKKGFAVMYRFGELSIILLITLIILFSGLSIPNMRIANVLPVMENGIFPVLKGALSAFAFPLGETVIFMMVFSNFKSSKSPYGIYIKALILGGVIISFLGFRNTLVLGERGVSRTYFPSYSALARIDIRNFLQRLEIGVSINFLFAGYLKIAICLLAACRGIVKLFNIKDYKFIVTPVGISMAILSIIIYKNIMEMAEWALDIWTYYAIPFQIILPIIIFIAAEIKSRKNKGDKKQQAGQ